MKHRIYSFPNYQFRILRSLFTLKKLDSFLVAFQANKAYRKSWLDSHYHKNYPVIFGKP